MEVPCDAGVDIVIMFRQVVEIELQPVWPLGYWRLGNSALEFLMDHEQDSFQVWKPFELPEKHLHVVLGYSPTEYGVENSRAKPIGCPKGHSAHAGLHKVYLSERVQNSQQPFDEEIRLEQDEILFGVDVLSSVR